MRCVHHHHFQMPHGWISFLFFSSFLCTKVINTSIIGEAIINIMKMRVNNQLLYRLRAAITKNGSHQNFKWLIRMVLSNETHIKNEQYFRTICDGKKIYVCLCAKSCKLLIYIFSLFSVVLLLSSLSSLPRLVCLFVWLSQGMQHSLYLFTPFVFFCWFGMGFRAFSWFFFHFFGSVFLYLSSASFKENNLYVQCVTTSTVQTKNNKSYTKKKHI